MLSNENRKNTVENVCPYCGEHLVMNKRTFANHVRWCKKNPRYEEIRTSTINKLKSFGIKRQTYLCNCAVCGKEYFVYVTPSRYDNKKYRKTCSDECAKILTAKHTDVELKNKKIRNKLKGTHKVARICRYCGKHYTGKRGYFCSDNCRTLYKLNGKTQKQVYKYCCAFTFSLNDFKDEFDFSLIKKFGWYSAKNRGNNLNGISRDHKFSCENGFKQLIDPYIISHPANCELLQQAENSMKHTRCSITIDKLISSIITWNAKYGKYANKINYDLLKTHGIELLIKFEL